MLNLSLDTINLLEDEDKMKISYLVNLLLKKEQYEKLRTELEVRREEIKQGETFSHDNIWNSLDV